MELGVLGGGEWNIWQVRELIGPRYCQIGLQEAEAQNGNGFHNALLLLAPQKRTKIR